jgi:uncharacterized membrane protein YeaQ/YmgE (transglycosylase-associated protein family)
MLLGKIIVWLIVGMLAGTLAGRLVTFSKEGLGRWMHLAIGMAGAVVGGTLFELLGIDFRLGELNITVENVISAFVGSLLCILAVWLYRRGAEMRRAIAAKRRHLRRNQRVEMSSGAATSNRHTSDG